MRDWGGVALKLEADIKTVAKSIIQGNEKRKKRIQEGNASAFDIKAVEIVANALGETCENIASSRARKQMQDKIYKSILYNQPYEYIADVCCGRRQFYNYRTEFISRVAAAMDMLPSRQQSSGSEYEHKI